MTTEVLSDRPHDGIEMGTPQMQPLLRDRDLILMAVATAIAVANLYYCQPLLGEMARSLNRSQIQIAHVAMATQVGYAEYVRLEPPCFLRLSRSTCSSALSPWCLLLVPAWRGAPEEVLCAKPYASVLDEESEAQTNLPVRHLVPWYLAHQYRSAWTHELDIKPLI